MLELVPVAHEQDPGECTIRSGEGSGLGKFPARGLGDERLMVEVGVDPPPPGRDPGLDHDHRPARLDGSAASAKKRRGRDRW